MYSFSVNINVYKAYFDFYFAHLNGRRAIGEVYTTARGYLPQLNYILTYKTNKSRKNILFKAFLAYVNFYDALLPLYRL
jgi:hypothetical protein